MSYEIPANSGYTRRPADRAGWTGGWASCARGADVDFVVVFFHHCAYSTTNSHASDGGVRDAWVPLFEKHQVDLVINGHNHVYERTDAIKGGRSRRAVPIGARTDPTRDGIVYVTAGGAGRSLYGFPGAGQLRGARQGPGRAVDTFHWTKGGGKATETVEWSRVRYTGFSFLSVEVGARRGAAQDAALQGRRRSPRSRGEARIDHFEVDAGAGA